MVIVDDLIQTGGTMMECAKVVLMVADDSHSLLSLAGTAEERSCQHQCFCDSSCLPWNLQ